MTNPPVPATPLDVEACVRLLERQAELAANRSAADRDYAERHEGTHPHHAAEYHATAAKYMEEAKLLRALASALPGMGKKAEWYDWLAEEDHVDWTRRLGNGNFAVETPPFGMKPDIERATLGECIDAARAAQPGETSADAT